MALSRCFLQAMRARIAFSVPLRSWAIYKGPGQPTASFTPNPSRSLLHYYSTTTTIATNPSVFAMSSFLSTGSLFRDVDELPVEGGAFNPMVGDMTYLAPAVGGPDPVGGLSFCDPRVIGSPILDDATATATCTATTALYDTTPYYAAPAASSDFDQYLVHLPLAPPSPIPTPPIDTTTTTTTTTTSHKRQRSEALAQPQSPKRQRPMPQSPPISPDQESEADVFVRDSSSDDEDFDFAPSESEVDVTAASSAAPHVSDSTATDSPPPPPPPKTRRGRKPSPDDSTKSFVCDHCNRRFRRQEHLKRHFRSLHTREKPFKCDECGKKFSRSDNLSQHARTHLKQSALASSPPVPSSNKQRKSKD